MRGLLHWFGLFLLVTIILGWAQTSLCWIFCELIAEDQKYFWPFMGFPMTFNMFVTFLWFQYGGEEEEQ